jgi:hypothetical protein
MGTVFAKCISYQAILAVIEISHVSIIPSAGTLMLSAKNMATPLRASARRRFVESTLQLRLWQQGLHDAK